MAALLVQQLPEGDEWVYEVKFDGYRALLIKDRATVEIRSRNNRSLTGDYPALVVLGQRLNARSAVLDGEVVAVDPEGRPSFQALQHRSSHTRHILVFYAFDLLHLDGQDLTALPLVERRAVLPNVVKGSGLFVCEWLPGTVSEITEVLRGLGLEGVIAKRLDSPYRAGQRNGDWQKLKLEQQQEFVIGGYRPGSSGVDALLVGYYAGRQLRFAGKVRAGFTPALRREVAVKLVPVHVGKCPFVDLPNSRTSHWGGGVTAEQMREMTWVRPTLVAQIRFVEWTTDGHLRHAAFVGLRPDKRATSVRREL